MLRHCLRTGLYQYIHACMHEPLINCLPPSRPQVVCVLGHVKRVFAEDLAIQCYL